MPKCLSCGNSTHFVSSSIPKSMPWNNGPSSGLVGAFNGSTLINIENQGLDHEQINTAWANPHLFFDSCSFCGSTNLLWP